MIKLVGIIILGALLLANANGATQIDSCTTISSNGTYVLNQSIVNSGATSCIYITASNVTFDGQGYTIDGVDAVSTFGVYVYNSTTTLTNVSIKNLTVTDWNYGIYYLNAQNGKIINNTANSNQLGIYLYSSSNNSLIGNIANSNGESGIRLESSSRNNTIKDNNASNNSYAGIYLYSSCSILEIGAINNTITDNTASNNKYGISLASSGDNILVSNILSKNKYNLDVWGCWPFHFIQNIDTTNKVDGKPVYYWLNQHDQQIPGDAGYVGIVNSENITVKDLILRNNGEGVLIVNTRRSRIENVNISNSFYGIWFDSSSQSTINSNIVNNTEHGIYLEDSYNNIVINNIAINNLYRGITLRQSWDNNLTNNTANNNTYYGIEVTISWHNNIIGNAVNNNGYHGIYINYVSHDNEITSNTANNNKNGIYIISPDSYNNSIYNNYLNNINNLVYIGVKSNYWNTTKILGTNIIGGPYLGGNFWANPSGTGFSQTCADVDRDGICDSAYVLDANNTDYLPLSLNFTKDTMPLDSSIGYSALVATGQNTYVQSSNGSFGLLLKGQIKTINNSVILNNTGDLAAIVEARFNDSIGGVYGLVSGANVLNATNFAFGLPSALMPLNTSGANVQVAVAPPGVTALDARLAVPNEQVAGDYSGTVILTFSNSI